MKFLLSLFTVFVLTESCNSTQKAMESTSLQEQPQLEGTYVISQIQDNKSLPSNISITFDASTSRVSGFGGCNNFSGTYTQKNNTLTFSNIIATEKYCLGDKSKFEGEFFKALNNANSFDIKDNELTLLTNNETLIKGIKEQETASKPMKGESTKEATKQIDNHYLTNSVTYTVTSRGFFQYIDVSGSKLSFSTDSSLKNIDSYTITEDEQIALGNMLKKVDIENIQKLKAPTNKRLFDGAKHAVLDIRQGDMIYKTPSFDDGFPPKEIEVLVNKILTIKSRVLKP